MTDEVHPRSPEPPVPQAGGLRSGVEAVRLTAWVRGRVQGVGFRWWVRSQALALGLRGWAENLADGRVKVVAEGPCGDCERLLDLLRGPDTPGHVIDVTHRWDEVGGSQGGPGGPGGPAGPPGFAER